MDRNKLSESEIRERSEADFLRFLEECLDAGWSPTRCIESCIVEPDGVCSHGFKSYLLEQGLI